MLSLPRALVIRDSVPVVGSQLVLPVAVAVGISIRDSCCSCDRISCLVRIFFGACQVSAQIVAVDESLVQVKVILPS